MALKDWKENKRTNFFKRWDKGTTEIHIIKQGDYPEKKDRNFLIEGSHSVGGFFGVGKAYAKTEKEALLIAKNYMKVH